MYRRTWPLPNGWARSSILSPCDLTWDNPAGIVAQCDANREMVATGTVDIDKLYENRKSGAATTFKDRRRRADLYRSWPSHILPDLAPRRHHPKLSAAQLPAAQTANFATWKENPYG